MEGKIMKIALIFPPAWSPDAPPLGIYCIASVLKEHGNHVDVFDLNILLWRHLKKHFKHAWNKNNSLYWAKYHASNVWDYEYWVEADISKIMVPEIELFLYSEIDRIIADRYDAIGFSLFFNTALAARLLIKRIKRINNRARLFIGGPFVDDLVFHNRVQTWFPDITAAVFGEGEIPVVTLINSWESGYTPHGEPGIITCGKRGKLRHTKCAKPFNLDESPLIDFGELDFSLYNENYLPISYGRGCVGNCAFCNANSKPFRIRRASYIVRDMKRYINKYGDIGFDLIAPAINGNTRHMSRLFDFCNTVIETKRDIKWSANARVSNDLNLDCLKLFKKAGCCSLVFGLESASDKVLKQMGKPCNSEMCEWVIKNTAKAGIQVSINIIVGFPGEDDVDFEKTASFIRKNLQYITCIAINPCFLVRGSRIYSNPSKFGIYVKNGGVMTKKEGNAELCGNKINFECDWVSSDLKNTIDIRLDRYKKLTSLINSTGISDILA
jgi:hypothetical protein